MADGVVTETLDGVPLNVRASIPAPCPSRWKTSAAVAWFWRSAAGARILRPCEPGSLRVKLGDKVRRGQVLGLVGKYGNSTEPHLHFHIANATAPSGLEGLLYALT